jgi:hypothetical protein
MLISDEKKSTARAIGDSSYRVAGLASSENSTSFFPIVVFLPRFVESTGHLTRLKERWADQPSLVSST